jgi:hypothetical protein
VFSHFRTSNFLTCAKVLLATACFALFGSAANAADLLYISEYTAPGISRGLVVQIPQEASLDQVTADFTSGQVQSNAFKSSTNFVRLVCTVQCSVLFGTNPTATNAKLLPALVPEYFAIPPGQNFKVFVQKSGGFPGSSYIGPGDITFNGSTANVKAYYSCARVLNNAKASTSTLMCDLVDSAAPTTVICTLRGTTSGFVDLSAYCPGGLTPAAKCAATSTTKCNIAKVYDQSGAGLFGDATQITAIDQPFLTFNALNGLPSIHCTSTVQCVLVSTNSVTLAPPLTISAVGFHDNATVGAPIFGGNTSTTSMNWNPLVAGQIGCNATTGIDGSVTDLVWHGISCQLGSSANANVDGASLVTGSTGAGGFSAETVRLFRGPGGIHQAQGQIMELMVNAAQTTNADLNNLFSNMNGANGYNGGL